MTALVKAARDKVGKVKVPRGKVARVKVARGRAVRAKGRAAPAKIPTGRDRRLAAAALMVASRSGRRRVFPKSNLVA